MHTKSGKIYHKQVVYYANPNALFINALTVLLQRKTTRWRQFYIYLVIRQMEC